MPTLPTDLPPLPTTADIKGKLTFSPESIFTPEVFGSVATAVMNVTGSATLDGMLVVDLLDGATVTGSDSFTVLKAASISGHFSNVASGRRVSALTSAFTPGGSFRATYSGNELVLSEFLPHAGLLNLSSRARVQTGDNVTIAGFIIGGSDAKRILLRGIGPSLTAKGVSAALANPTLDLYDASGSIVMSNDDWQKTQAQEIQATGLAPSDAHESALIATLAPGSYTAILRGISNSVGVGLVELYDLDEQPAYGELTNISTRGRVESGENVLIGGIVIQPGEAAHLIVRAIGASLGAQHVAGPLADPTLDLYNAAGTKIQSNDNWNDDPAQSAQLQKEGLAPSDIRESALVATVNPGAYTAIVRGKNNTAGVALIEFFKLN